MTPVEMAKQIVVRSCESHEDLKLCVDLQLRIWGYEDEDVVPTAIFVVAQHTGGHAYLAFDGTRAVGFALAFSAEHAGKRLWHSHMVGVLPEYQNLGVGRLLKLHQRSEALKHGIDLIEWTFDPLALRNAHFNISRLGAIVRRYIPNCYGESTSVLHRGLPTDRFVAEWHIRTPRVEQILNGTNPPPAADAIEIAIPASINELKSSAPERAAEIQSDLRSRVTDLFARGYAVTGFRRGSETCYYVLESM